MPGINKMRVANVNFKQNTRRYDDLIVHGNSLNTLIDGENGDGKTLYAQCAFQSIIPNSYFHPDNTIKRLFKDNNNSTMHSLIEWELDRGNEYDFMITGFCAKDTQKSGEEERKTFEYFNYVILYKKEFPFSVESIPLKKDVDGKVSRMGYKQLKDFLKNLSERDSRCYVKTFSLNKEYLQFLYQYGINEAEWILQFNTNKQEGGAENHFTTNYKHPKDLIVKEIIPIIESIDRYRLGEEATNQVLAKSLMSISQNIKQLKEKTQRLGELKLVEDCLARVVQLNDDLIEALKAKDDTYIEVVKGYNLEISLINEFTDIIGILEKKKEDLLNKSNSIDMEILAREEEYKDRELEEERFNSMNRDLDIKERAIRNRSERESILREISELEIVKGNIEKEILSLNENNDNLSNKLHELELTDAEKRAENVYVDYRDANNKIQQHSLKLDLYNKGNEEILAQKKEAESMYLFALNKSEASLKHDLDELITKQSDIESKRESVLDSVVTKTSLLNSNKSKIEDAQSIIKSKELLKLEIEKKNEELENNKEVALKEISASVDSLEDVNECSQEFDSLKLVVSTALLSEMKATLSDGVIDKIKDRCLPIMQEEIDRLGKKMRSMDEDLRKERLVVENDNIKNELANKLEILEEKSSQYIEKENGILSKVRNLSAVMTSNESKIGEVEDELLEYREKVSEIADIIELCKVGDRFECRLSLMSEVSDLKSRYFELSRSKEELDSKLIDLNGKGLSLPSNILKGFGMIESIYSSALLGRDFIDELSIEQKSRYLEKTTLIPYSILLNAKDYTALKSNESLKNKLGDMLIPVVNMDSLKVVDKIDEETVYINTLPKEAFIDEERRKLEIKKVEDELVKIEHLLNELNLMMKKKEKSLDLVSSINLRYSATFEFDNEQIIQKLKKINADSLDELKEQEDLLSLIAGNKKENVQKIRETKEAIINQENHIKARIKEVNSKIDIVSKMISTNAFRENVVMSIGSSVEKYIVNDVYKMQNVADMEKLKLEEIESENRISRLVSQNKNLEIEISNLNIENLTLAENRAELDGLKTDAMLKIKEVVLWREDVPSGTVEKENNVSLNDLQNQVRVLNRNIEKEFSAIKDLEEEINQQTSVALRKKDEIINTLKVSFEMLDAKSNKIVINSSEVFESIKRREEALKVAIEENGGKVQKLNDKNIETNTFIKIKTQNAGAINIYEDIVIEEGYNVEYERKRVKTLIVENKEKMNEIRDEIKKSNTLKTECFREMSKVEKDLRSEEGNLNEMLINKSETERIIESKGINKSITQECSESLSFVINDASKRIKWHEDKVNSISLKHRAQTRNTYETLEDSIFEFISVLKDIEPPTSQEDAITQNNNIISDEGYLYYLRQEKLSLDKELEDLGLMKTEFISRCVSSVEVLIEKLKNLSKQSTVVLNGKKIKLIELKLYELNSEQKLEKMTNYIDNLLRALENDLENGNEEDSVKALNMALTASRLLEQGIRNLKNCEVNIYVPDSVNVEDGYYEKWGGGASGGQRNMMYLTTVMALIIFIRESSSLEGASQNTKVMFGDGPFRGANAVYLWEPVFKLMQENNIQFIVTNYATQPGLMNLFSSVAVIAGVETLVNGKRVIQNELRMDSIFSENSKSLRGDNILVKYEDYKVPVIRKTKEKEIVVAEGQIDLYSLLDSDEDEIGDEYDI